MQSHRKRVKVDDPITIGGFHADLKVANSGWISGHQQEIKEVRSVPGKRGWVAEPTPKSERRPTQFAFSANPTAYHAVHLVFKPTHDISPYQCQLRIRASQKPTIFRPVPIGCASPLCGILTVFV